jgi:hypothetical protein
MNQALITALQTSVNDKNIILLVPYACPEDDIISAMNEFIKLAEESKAARQANEAEVHAQTPEADVAA